jgi:hypothetical protein
MDSPTSRRSLWLLSQSSKVREGLLLDLDGDELAIGFGVGEHG